MWSLLGPFPRLKCCRCFKNAGILALPLHIGGIRNKTSAAKSHRRQQVAAHRPLQCRGNKYSQILPDERPAIHELLLSRCHPVSLLEKEGYVLEADPRVTATDLAGVSAAADEKALKHVFFAAPEPDESLPKRQAVVLDCEMVGLKGSQAGVAQICAIDFLTGEKLVSSLVKPRQPVQDWRAKITGLSKQYMAKAAARGRVLAGTAAARAELMKHIDKNTVLVGQSVHHDLVALQIAHDKIIDTAIMTSEAVFGEPAKRFARSWGLKVLCEQLLDLKIRHVPKAMKKLAHAHAHNSLEDVLAAREVVLRCLRHPSELDVWAVKTREALARPRKSR